VAAGSVGALRNIRMAAPLGRRVVSPTSNTSQRTVMLRVPVRTICATLGREYGNPRHGNKRNPLNELFYIILSTRTRGDTFAGMYLRVKRAFPSWSAIRPKDRAKLERILIPGGLGKLKARQMIGILETLRATFGRPTVASLKKMSDDEAEAFLTALPGVGRKVAKCVLMYALDREVLPVDVHVHRIAGRIGLLTKKRPDTSQDLIENEIPKALRYGFHVNAVAHGRRVCLPQRPRCETCCIARLCAYGAKRIHA
jgi:endonuclease III